MISIIKAICIVIVVAVHFAIWITIMDITSKLYKRKFSVRLYFSEIRSYFLANIVPSFYLNKRDATKYTLFGKIVITIFSFIILGIPFLLASIASIFIWIIIRIGRKLILK